MTLVTTTGYILSVEGLYYADARNNDASILNHMIQDPSNGFSSLLQGGGVCLVVDRGFRDSVALVESLGHEVRMPNLLPRNQKQLTCAQANESRLCTAVRWVVESVYGRLKNVFKFFGRKISNHYICSDKLNRFIRIACAMLNKYFPPIVADRVGDEGLANRMLERASNSNALEAFIEKKKLLTQRID